MPNEHAPAAHTKATDTCWPKVGDNEPVFVLRAQDKTAPAAVQKWIDDNIWALTPTHPKIIGAIATRDAMMEWAGARQAD